MKKNKKHQMTELFYHEDKPGVYRKVENGRKVSVSVLPYGRSDIFYGRPDVNRIKDIAKVVFERKQPLPNAYVISDVSWVTILTGYYFVDYYLIVGNIK